MVYNGILMETIGISVMVSVVFFLAGTTSKKNNWVEETNI